MTRQTPVPSHRVSRLWHLGRLVGGSPAASSAKACASWPRGDDETFVLPTVDERLTTPEVLAMSFVTGDPIETLAATPQALRDRVATQLWDLMLRKFFAWGLVQTDPNFANYRYGRLPPPDVLFLHRKLGGMCLLSQRLRARVDLHGLLSAHALA